MLEIVLAWVLIIIVMLFVGLATWAIWVTEVRHPEIGKEMRRRRKVKPSLADVLEGLFRGVD